MNRWRLFANLATLANALVGAFAVVYILLGNPIFGMLLIAIGVGFDGMDGMLSRRAPDGGGRFGRAADASADAITFALAPAMLLAVAGIPIAALYFVLAIARLTYFALNAYDRPNFVGVPTPVSALAVIWLGAAFYLPAFFSVQPWIYGGFALVLSLLMLAPWGYPKIRRGSALSLPMGITGIAAALVLVPLQFRPAVDSPLYLLSFGAGAVMAAGLLIYYIVGPWTVSRPRPVPARRPEPE